MITGWAGFSESCLSQREVFALTLHLNFPLTEIQGRTYPASRGAVI